MVGTSAMQLLSKSRGFQRTVIQGPGLVPGYSFVKSAEVKLNFKQKCPGSWVENTWGLF